jgi:hypothetical protein
MKVCASEEFATARCELAGTTARYSSLSSPVYTFGAGSRTSGWMGQHPDRENFTPQARQAWTPVGMAVGPNRGRRRLCNGGQGSLLRRTYAPPLTEQEQLARKMLSKSGVRERNPLERTR